jgi:hypothetical protein
VIRKFLSIGKQLTLTSTRFELVRDDGVPPPIEIKAPVEVFWEAQRLLAEAESLLASGEDSNSVKDVYEAVLLLLIPHCALEKDRTWLYEQVVK